MLYSMKLISCGGTRTATAALLHLAMPVYTFCVSVDQAKTLAVSVSECFLFICIWFITYGGGFPDVDFIYLYCSNT